MALAGMTEFETAKENEKSCKAIAHKLEAAHEGRLYHCPHCGDNIEPEEIGSVYQIPEYDDEVDEPDDFDIDDYWQCPFCKNVFERDEFEEVGLCDLFDDVFDIEYRIGSDGEFRSVQIMIACGGPNIYVDTADNSVRLYWWTDRAHWYFDRETGDEIDAIWQEHYECCRH